MSHRAGAKRQVFAAAFLPLFVVFLATASWHNHRTLSPDPRAAAMSAWAVAETGSLVMREPPDTAWLKPVPGGFVTNRQPGVIAAGVPFYALARPFTDGFSTAPMAIAAAAWTALAGGLLAVLLHNMGARRRTAILATWLGSLGTATWSVSADALWTHGPDQALLLAGLLAISRERYVLASTALVGATTVRTHLAVVGVTLAVAAVVCRRSLRCAALLAMSAVVGTGLVLLYTRLVFRNVSLNAGYGATSSSVGYDARGGPTRNFVSRSTASTLENLMGLLFSPDRGLFTTAPFVLLLLVAGVMCWRTTHWWVRGAALSGFAYLVVQARVNHWSGGGYFWGSRLTIEPLTLFAPLMWLGWREKLATRTDRRAAVFALACVSIAMTSIGAVFFTPHTPINTWTNWWPGHLILLGPHAALTAVVMGTGLVSAAVVVLVNARRGSRAALQAEAGLGFGGSHPSSENPPDN